MTQCVAIIQARLNSSRLPGKALLPLAGTTVLGLMIARVKVAKKVDQIIVATTSNTVDDPLCEEARKHGVSVFRGSEQDVLDRFYCASSEYGATVIVRLTADCPLMDGALIDLALDQFATGSFDYFGNVIERGFPDGLDIEIFTMSTLTTAALKCEDAWSREHVTPYMRTGADLPVEMGDFRIGHLKADSNFSHLRWTLDTPTDYEFFCALDEYDIIEKSWLEIVALLTKNADLLMWNRGLDTRSVRNANPRCNLPRNGYQQSVQHLSRALQTIPVGSQTFSKSYLGWVMNRTPLYAKCGSGAFITDVDGNHYIDYMMALLPVVLGYADPFVDAAVVKQLALGNCLSLAGSLEAELSEKLASLIPCAEMVRFGKNGSDATTAAVRLARAYTGKEKVIVCGYHGWHDWYIGSTTKNLGVPTAVGSLTETIPFNDVEALTDLLKQNGDKFAALVIEPTGKLVPANGFLEEVRRLCSHFGIVLIFDEVITGFRVDLGGAQAHYKVVPDLAAFGKAMANGYPLSALVGRREIMSKLEDIFFSATFSGELSAIAAAIATINKLEKTDAVRRIHLLGQRMMTSLNASLSNSGLDGMIKYSGEAWWPRVVMNNLPVDQSVALALIRQEYTAQGLLIASGLNFCLAHDETGIFEQTIKRASKAFDAVSDALHSPDPTKFIRGDIAHSDFEVRAHMSN